MHETTEELQVILLADDDDMVGRVTDAMLRMAGYGVIRAGDGVEALALAARYGGRIALLLTDVQMPRMDGPALAARLADLRPGTPVIYMSGHMEGERAARRATTAGAAFLAKPFTRNQLVSVVRTVLGAQPPPAPR